MKRVRREPEKVVPVDAGLIARWREQCDVRKAAEKAEKAALTEILTAIGDAEAGECYLGTFTYLEQSRSTFDTKALKEAMPEIFEKYSDVTKYRVARLKAQK